MAANLPTEWAPCPELEGIEIKLDSGTLMFRLTPASPTAPSHLVGWWARPADAGRHWTAVQAFNPRGGTNRLGKARTLADARKLVARHLGRPVGQGSARQTVPGAVAGGSNSEVVVEPDGLGEGAVVPVDGLEVVVGTEVPGGLVEAVEGAVAGASVDEAVLGVTELLDAGAGWVVLSWTNS